MSKEAIEKAREKNKLRKREKRLQNKVVKLEYQLKEDAQEKDSSEAPTKEAEAVVASPNIPTSTAVSENEEGLLECKNCSFWRNRAEQFRINRDFWKRETEHLNLFEKR